MPPAKPVLPPKGGRRQRRQDAANGRAAEHPQPRAGLEYRRSRSGPGGDQTVSEDAAESGAEEEVRGSFSRGGR